MGEKTNGKCFYYLGFFLSSVCTFFSFERPKNVSLCYMNVCVLIYLWFAKMKILKHVADVVTEKEKEKKIPKYDWSAFDQGRRRVTRWRHGDVTVMSQSLKILQEVLPPLGSRSGMELTGRTGNSLALGYFLVPIVTSRLPCPHRSGSRLLFSLLWDSGNLMLLAGVPQRRWSVVRSTHPQP